MPWPVRVCAGGVDSKPRTYGTCVFNNNTCPGGVSIAVDLSSLGEDISTCADQRGADERKGASSDDRAVPVAFADHRQAASDVDQQHDQIEQTHSASVYDLGLLFDLIQPFSSRVHSTGFFFIRAAAAAAVAAAAAAAADPITAVADRFTAVAAAIVAKAAAEKHQLTAATQAYVDNYLNET
jgi:hypothetical protein